MAYVDKIIVEGTTYDIGSKLSEIRDSNGNQRFIEGTPNTSVTWSGTPFIKWTLSGSHLMIVCSGEMASGTTWSAGQNLIQLVKDSNIPAWVYDKVYKVSSVSNFYTIEIREALAPIVGGTSYETVKVRLGKSNSDIFVDVLEAHTFSNDCILRLQFDLIIDTD